MAPSPPSHHISNVDYASQLFQRLDLLEHHFLRHSKNMDCLDVDQLVDVPDTPDRLVAQNRTCSTTGDSSQNGNLPDRRILDGLEKSRRLATNGRNKAWTYRSHERDVEINDELKPGVSLSISSSNAMTTFDGLKESSRLVDRVSRRPRTNLMTQMQHTESLLDQKRTQLCVPSSSRLSTAHRPHKIKLVSRRTSDTAKTSAAGLKDQAANREKMVDSNQKFTSSVVDSKTVLEKWEALSGQEVSDPRRGPQKAVSIQTLESTSCRTSKDQLHDADERVSESSGSAHKLELDATVCRPSMSTNPVAKLNSGNKGKEVDLSFDCQPKSGKERPLPSCNVISPLRTGHRRLVRNGCISPFNIAKRQGLSNNLCQNATNEKQNGNGKVEISNPSNEASSHVIHVISPVSVDHEIDRKKGKGLMVDSVPADENVAGTIPSSRDMSSPLGDDLDARNANDYNFKFTEEMGGWRSTSNCSKNTHIPVSLDSSYTSKTLSSCSSSNNRNKEIELGNKDQVMVINDGPENDTASNQFSSQRAVPNSHQVQVSSRIVSELDLEDECRGRQILMKRLKKSSSLRHKLGECSASTSDEPEISLIPSSTQPSNLRRARTVGSQRRNISRSVIEVDELDSPESRSSNELAAHDSDSNARARQVEADEMLARQLQEQFYQELPGTDASEVGLTPAWEIQHEDAEHFPSAPSSRLLSPRVSLSRNTNRDYQLQYIQNTTARPVNRIRRSPFARMADTRRNSYGRSHVAFSRGFNIRFPSNMDVEMRLSYLEEMEAAGDIDAAAFTRADALMRLQRDFNENDYEMLLALDENNRYAGASENQINSLPQSTVQTNDSDEACAICLETPSSGDTMRHLPCLHKFHKECIDAWLRRRRSCPVCKSSIT